MHDTLCDIFRNLFGTPRHLCTDQLSMDDVEGWDSVNHMTLVLSLEQAFGISLSPEEIPELTSFGKIKSVLVQHNVMEN